MNRVIKFRGQNEKGKWFYGSLNVEYDGSTRISYWYNKLVEPETNYYEPSHELEDVLQETVGQFTSLLDKNGKEIYEGDIVKPFLNERHSAQVMFVSGSFKFLTKDGNGNYHGWNYFKEEIEVIGNIHETPELVTPTK